MTLYGGELFWITWVTFNYLKMGKRRLAFFWKEKTLDAIGRPEMGDTDKKGMEGSKYGGGGWGERSEVKDERRNSDECIEEFGVLNGSSFLRK